MAISKVRIPCVPNVGQVEYCVGARVGFFRKVIRERDGGMEIIWG